MSQIECKNCDMCHKEGLPILLTRYAVATKDSVQFYKDYSGTSFTGKMKGVGELYKYVTETSEQPASGKTPPSNASNAPVTQGKTLGQQINEWDSDAARLNPLAASGAPNIQDKANFKVAEQNKNPISLGDYAYYTLRLLRPGGFVYVLNEKAPQGYPKWRGFHVVGGSSGEEEDSAGKDKKNAAGKKKRKEINRDAWKGVFFEPFDAQKDFTQENEGKPQKSVPCVPEKNGVKAGCITISTEELATTETIWIAYSDVRWSGNVLNNYMIDKDGCRTKNMRAINVKQYGKNKHAAGIDELADHVAEYADKLNIEAFDFAIAPMSERKSYPIPDKDGKEQKVSPAAFTAHHCKKLNENAFFVALDDPVGIAADLAELMDARFDAFVEQPNFGRKLASAMTIVSLRTGVYNQADLECVEDAKEYSKKFDAEKKTMEAAQIFNPKRTDLIKPEDKEFYSRNYDEDPYAPIVDGKWEDWRTNFNHWGLLSAPAFEHYRDAAWRRYQYDLPSGERAPRITEGYAWQTASWVAPEGIKKRFDDKAVDDFLKKFEEEKKWFTDTYTLPLAHAHVGWMTSKALSNCFKWHFDGTDPRFGVKILEVLGLCIGGTQDKTPCAELYEKWLEVEDIKKALADGNLIWHGCTLGGCLADRVIEAFSDLDKLNLKPDDLAETATRVEPVSITPEQKSPIKDAATKVATSKQTVGAAADTVKGVMNAEKNWEKTKKEWEKPKIYDADRLTAFPLLERGYETVKFLIEPLMDVAEYVLLKGTPTEAQLKNKPAELLNRFVGGWLNRFLTHVFGPMARVFESKTADGKLAPIMVFPAAANGQVMLLMGVQGSERDYGRHLLHLLGESAPDGGQKNSLLKLVEDRMKVLQAESMGRRVSLDGIRTAHMAATMPYEDVKKLCKGVPLYNGMSGIAKMELRALLNRSLGAVPLKIQNALCERNYSDVANMLEIRRKVLEVHSKFGVAKAAVKIREGVRKYTVGAVTFVSGARVLGVFYGLLNWMSVKVAVNALNKAELLEEDQFNAWGRLGVAVISSFSTISKAMAEIVFRVNNIAQAMGRQAIITRIKREVLNRISKRLLRGAIIATGGLDIKKGVEEWGEGKKLVGVLWIASGVAAIVSIFGYFAAGWPMVILFLISIAIIALIVIFSDDDFQKWLSRCIFGNGDSSGVRYPNMEREMDALELAGK